MKIRIIYYFFIVCILFPSFLHGCSGSIPYGIAPSLTYLDPYTIVSDKHLWRDIPSIDEDGLLNVIVEIPAGRTEKWEVRKEDGALVWDLKKGKPRVVKYIGYPGNYGMIPQTLLSKEIGGDGDPLDVIILGPPILRGSIAKAKLIGVLKLLDGEEQDDKLITVGEDSLFYKVDSLEELNKKFPGVLIILESWFLNYKGVGEIKSKGFAGIDVAKLILSKAIEHYRKAIF
jgi:inorganic pyrophosphatase